MKVKVRSRLLSVRSVLNFKLIWVDAMPIITESRIVQWQNIIYDVGNTNGSLDLFAVESYRGIRIAVSQIGEKDYFFPNVKISPFM